MLYLNTTKTETSRWKTGRSRNKRRAFTLVQMLVAVGVLGALSALILGALGRSRASAQRAQCDVQLKEVVMAIDTYKQERGHLPPSLNTLVDNEYISPELLHCSADSHYSAARATDPRYSSYGDGYVLREPRDSGELPMIVCPFHEQEGSYGAQGFKGGYTKQFSAHPATLAFENFSGAVTVTRPSQGVLTLPAKHGEVLKLHGGDRIKTGAGSATISFDDGSTSTIEPNSDLSVLQSFTEGQRTGGLYTLVRQFKGRVNYYVNPGSNFDVATPTATAGALGTRFSIQLVPASSLGGNTTLSSDQTETILTVTEHTVALSTTQRTIEVTDKEPAVIAHSPSTAYKERKPRRAGARPFSAVVAPTATPNPTPIPTTRPTSPPPSTEPDGDDDDDDDNSGKGKGKDKDKNKDGDDDDDNGKGNNGA